MPVKIDLQRSMKYLSEISKWRNVLPKYTEDPNYNGNVNNKKSNKTSNNSIMLPWPFVLRSKLFCLFLAGFAFLLLLMVGHYGGGGSHEFLLVDNEWEELENYQQFKQQQQENSRKLLRIAQIAPLWEPVPPKKYGGTERIVSYLTEELVRRGHQVTLFASNDSVTSARFGAKWPNSKQNPVPNNYVPFRWLMDKVREGVNQNMFDILHFHTEVMGIETVDQICKENHTAVLLTIHTIMSIYPEYGAQYRHLPIVSISQDQRRHAAGRPNFVANVYHGIPPLYNFIASPNGKKPYLVFLGRIHPTKGPIMAIEIAIQAGIPLRMAAKIDHSGQSLWDGKVKPLIVKHKDLIEFIGEVNDTEKGSLLGNALALLFPIDWAEPFGIVMIEAMACGTPVVARRRGAVPEVVEEGVSGLIFESLEEGVAAVKKVASIDRAGVRRAFEQRFTVEKMVDGYEELYYQRLGIKSK